MARIKGWDSATPFFKRIINTLRPKSPLKRRLQEVLYVLQVQKEKLDEALTRLQQRDRELFEKTLSAYMAKDKARAVIYASEVAELRRMAQIVIASSLALEKVIVRLETIRDLGEVIVAMAPVVPVLRDLREQLAGVVPEAAMELEQVTNMVNSMLIEIGQASASTVSVDVVDEEAKKILEQVQEIAKMKLEERFPKLPEELKVEPPYSNLVMTLGSLGASKGVKGIVRPRSIPLEELERKVLEYARHRKGFIDVKAVASEFNVSREDVLRALKSLEMKGKIRMYARGEPTTSRTPLKI